MEMLRNVPGSHDAGIWTTLPRGQPKPASHSMHAVEPARFWYVPSSQLVHEGLDAFAAKVPAGQTAGADAPMLQAWPAGHSAQSL